MPRNVKLSVNIDHIATLRNARGEHHPSVLRAAEIVHKAGAKGITIHLREDRRHIRDKDLVELTKWGKLPINLETAATAEMLAIALEAKPKSVCIVPEKREEITTEGGLDLTQNTEFLAQMIQKLQSGGILVSLFIDPSTKQLQKAKQLNADIVEFHTGSYCNATEGNARQAELQKIIDACALAQTLDIICQAGHGLNYDTIPAIAKISNITELNIGHFIIGEAIYEGLENTIKKTMALCVVDA